MNGPQVSRPTDPAALLEVAIEAAKVAGAIALQGYGTALEIESKGGTDIVTRYDRAAERAALELIGDRYRGHAFLAEESGASEDAAHPGASAHDPGAHGYIWMVDPIDGTHNYAFQIPFWCVSVAVAERAGGELLAGVVYDPVHFEIYTASRGNGAFLNGTPIHVTNKGDVAQAIVAYDIGHAPDVARKMVDLIARVQPRVAKVRHLGSAALSLTYVAAGRIDAYYHLSLQPWDIAAAMLLIREAGGIVSDWDGSPRSSDTGGAIAAGSALHAPLMDLLTSDA